MTNGNGDHSSALQATKWYDLFSRGARDWLRHNEKVRDSVKEALPDLVTGSDVISNPENRTVKVPVKFLEHYRFRLSDADSRTGVGQGEGTQAGDVLRPAAPTGKGSGGAGSGEGGLEFVLELKVDDILDWLWEELELPNLEPRPGDTLEQTDFVREGIEKRGVRARLDRRRTVKEAVKRRAIQTDPIPFSDEDLRFRQLARRPQPLTMAVVIFVLDVSSSMDDWSRKLAKTFFFWALQGLRRQHTRIDSVFIGHTVEAWEFSEEEFFSVRGAGGTEASKGFDLAQQVLEERYDVSRYNSYVFYASDGDNFGADHDRATECVEALSKVCNFLGYVEVARRAPDLLNTEMGRIFKDLVASGADADSYAMTGDDDVWEAIRRFFRRQVETGD